MTLTPERWQKARDVLHEAMQIRCVGIYHEVPTDCNRADSRSNALESTLTLLLPETSGDRFVTAEKCKQPQT